MVIEQGPLIVIAYDGSEGARDAVYRAAETVSQRTALVVYAYPHAEEMSAGLGVPVTMPTDAVQTLQRRADEIANKGAELARTSGFVAEAVAVEAKGGVADALLSLARERGAAAIVMGSRGLGGAASALLGSVRPSSSTTPIVRSSSSRTRDPLRSAPASSEPDERPQPPWHYGPPMNSPSRSRGVQDSGWAVFAGVLFLLAGVFHVMWGIAAFASDDTFIADELLFGDLSLWGVFYLVVGALQLAAAWLVSTARRSGQIMGLILAGLSAINAMLTFAAYPLWSATILVLDLLVIYGLAVHGDDYA